MTVENRKLTQPPYRSRNFPTIHVSPDKTFPHGEGGSTCADGRGKNVTNLAVLDSTLNINSPAIPLPPTSVGTFPSGKVFGCPKRRMHNRNHPTSDYKLSWLFIKCRRFRRSWSSTIESVEAVQKGAPAKAQQSGFGGERRSSGTTELLPRKAKRRMWSLRRRDGPKSR